MSFCHLSPNSLSTVAPQHVAAPRLMMKIMMTGQEKQIKGLQLSVKKCKMSVVEIVAYMWASEWLFANNWCDPSFLLSLSLMRANVTESVPITDVPPGTPTPLPCSTHSNAICHLPPPFLASWGSQKKAYCSTYCMFSPSTFWRFMTKKRLNETLQTLGKWKIHRFNQVHGLLFIYIYF